jgi:predicted RND superfamily exporter protein
VRQIGALYERFLDAAHRRPGPWLALALVLTAIAGVTASRIELRTDFRELLPRDYRSVTDLQRIEERTGGLGTLVLVAESPDRAANIRIIQDLGERLRRFPREEIRWVDDNVREERAFLERNKLLYIDHDDLVTFRDRLKAKIEEERRKHDPLDLNLEPAAPAPPLEIEKYREKYRQKIQEYDRDPDGYYVGEGGRLVALYVRVPGSATSVDQAKRLLTKVEALIAGLTPARYHPEMKVSLTGDVRTAVEEYEATKEDLFVVSGLCIGLELVVILLFFFNAQSVLLLGVPVLMGTAWTFGLTALTIGFLNTSTMFLASIVAGNGINFGIILLARYFEERRAGGEVRPSLSLATRYTARATAVAALASSAAYGSLLITSFRGFNQFGFIGGVGMILCWLAAFLVIPALISFLERIQPVARGPRPRARRSLFSAGFAALATRYPRTLVALGLALFAAAAVFGGIFLHHEPFLYNFRFLRSEESRDSGSGALSSRVQHAVGKTRSQPAGMIILADRLDQVPQLEEALRAKRDVHPPGRQPIGEITTIFHLLPKDQERKLPVLREIRELLTQNALKFLTPAQRQDVQKLIPPADLRPVGVADLPEKMARPFTDVDGQRGLLVYVAPAPQMSVWDGRDLMTFARAVREIRLPGDEVIHASGHPVIFADMLRAVLADGPRAALLSFVGVVVLVVVALRRLSLTLLTLGVLVLGVTWLVGAMGAWDWLVRQLSASGAELSEAFVGAIPKLNFLNFIVLPLTVGIGVDYAVNVAQRYRLEGEGSMQRVIESTGGAVVLCSLTTIIGYSSLLLSRNLALVSFGKLANLGEIACLAAALLVLPSAVILVERTRARRAPGVQEVRQDEEATS